jgi:hypothetical protein
MTSIEIPEGVYTMAGKKSIVKATAGKYRKVSRKEKIDLLDDLEKATHLHRKYLTMLLNNTGKVRYTSEGIKLVGDPTVTYIHKRGRKKKYTKAMLPYLKALWVLTGYRSSIHLKAFITAHHAWLLAGIPQYVIDGFPKEMRTDLQPLHHIPAPIQVLLRTVSSATIERLLKPLKDQYKLKHKYKPHPHASVLKKQIPVETHFDKPRGQLGYTELDTVHHCGMATRGSYCLTLSEVEINTHWTELRTLRNKAHQWTYQALIDIDKVVPFKIHSRHVDNGSEFINQPVFSYTQNHGMRYTRSRAYHKNDNPVVESRHWTLVRSQVGYRRYDTDVEYKVLRELMPLISLKNNYFMPTMMTIKKVRVGGKVRKKYNIDTPYNRVLELSAITEQKKQELTERKFTLSYLKLLQKIIKLQLKLDRVYRKKYTSSPEDE